MQRYLGVFIALASAILYAATVNIIPFAQAVGGSVGLYLAMRGLCNFVLSFAPSPNRGGVFFLSRQQPVPLCALGIMVAVQGFSYVTALHFVPISIATPLFFLFPVITYLLQKILQRRPIHLVALSCLALSSLGVWLLAQGEGGEARNLALGVGCALLGALSQAIVNAIITRIRGLDAWQILRASYLPSFVIFLGYALTQPLPPMAAIGWTAISALAFFIGSALFLQSMKMLGAIRTSNVMYSEPMLSVLFSVILHNDHLSGDKIVAIFLVIGSTLMLEYHEHRVRQNQALQNHKASSS